MTSKNLILKGATWNGVESVDFPVSGGGTARYVETSDANATASDIAQGKTAYVNGSLITGTASGGGGDTWTWMGKNPTKTKTIVSPSKTYLKDTPYATWTPTNTLTTLVSASDIQDETIDASNCDYHIIGRFHMHFEYAPNTEQKNLINDYYYVSVQSGCSYGSNMSSFTADTGSSTANTSNTTASYLFYKNSNGVDTLSSNQYGVFPTWTLAGNSSGSHASRLHHLKYPIISARCSNTYFTTARAAAVDQDKSYYEMSAEIWTVARGTASVSGNYHILRDNILNGF